MAIAQESYFSEYSTLEVVKEGEGGIQGGPYYYFQAVKFLVF